MIIGTPIAHNANLPLGYVKSILKTDAPHIFQEGHDIADNRNVLFDFAKNSNVSLLLVDSDMVFEKKDVRRMAELLKIYDIVTGVCVMGFAPTYPPALFRKTDIGYESVAPQQGIHEVDACGAAFLGISARVIQELTKPFRRVLDPVSNAYFGEDISFCIRARERHFKIWCDSSLTIGHIKLETKYYEKA